MIHLTRHLTISATITSVDGQLKRRRLPCPGELPLDAYNAKSYLCLLPRHAFIRRNECSSGRHAMRAAVALLRLLRHAILGSSPPFRRDIADAGRLRWCRASARGAMLRCRD